MLNPFHYLLFNIYYNVGEDNENDFQEVEINKVYIINFEDRGMNVSRVPKIVQHNFDFDNYIFDYFYYSVNYYNCIEEENLKINCLFNIVQFVEKSYLLFI